MNMEVEEKAAAYFERGEPEDQVIDLQTIYYLLCEDDEGAILRIPQDFDFKLFLMDITIKEPSSDFARQQSEQIDKIDERSLGFDGSDLVEQSSTNRFGRKSQQP